MLELLPNTKLAEERNPNRHACPNSIHHNHSWPIRATATLPDRQIWGQGKGIFWSKVVGIYNLEGFGAQLQSD
jgi:hypothetical protein